MKREFLEGLGIDKENIDKIMAENGKDIESFKSNLSTKETELASIKEQLTNANKEIEGFKDLNIDEIKQRADKYKEDYKALEKQSKEELENFKYEVAVKEYASHFAFANERVKNSIINDIKEKGFKLEDGKLLGADDYMEGLKKDEPTSFKVEEDKINPPNFIRPNSGGGKIEVNKESIMAIKDPIERKRQIAEHIELFN